MLVNLYKSKTPVAVFSFPVLIGLLGACIFFLPAEIVPGFFSWQSDLSNFIFANSITHYITVVLIVYLSGIELNRQVNVYGFYSKNTYLPGLIYALILFGFGQMSFSMPLVAAGFLIYGLGYLFRINRQDSAISSVFMSSLLLGTATVFEPFLAPVIVLPWFSLVVFRSFVWREWIILLFGVGTPWLYHYGLHYAIVGEVEPNLSPLTFSGFNIDLSLEQMVLIGFALFIAVYAIWQFLVITGGQLLVFKKRSRLLFHLIWLTIVSLVLGWLFYDALIIATSIPLAIIIAVQMLNARTDTFGNLVLFVWIGLSVWSLFFQNH